VGVWLAPGVASRRCVARRRRRRGEIQLAHLDRRSDEALGFIELNGPFTSGDRETATLKARPLQIRVGDLAHRAGHPTAISSHRGLAISDPNIAAICGELMRVDAFVCRPGTGNAYLH